MGAPEGWVGVSFAHVDCCLTTLFLSTPMG